MHIAKLNNSDTSAVISESANDRQDKPNPSRTNESVRRPDKRAYNTSGGRSAEEHIGYNALVAALGLPYFIG